MLPGENAYATPLEAALAYARMGWRVFPVHHAVATQYGYRCSCGQKDCGSPAKHPRHKAWQVEATTDEAKVRQWWGRWQAANVGVATGAESGVVVLDVDPRHEGDTSMAVLHEQHGFPTTVESLTGGGGVQLFFAHPGSRTQNSSGQHGWVAKLTGLPGLDFRGDGGYVVAPPSVHASGGRYRWRADASPEEVVPAPLPEWLRPPTDEPPPPPPPPPNRGPAGGGHGGGRPPFDDAGGHWLDKYVKLAAEGGRNDVGFKLAQQLRDSQVSMNEAEGFMRDYQSRVTGLGGKPYTVKEAIASLRSAYSRPPREPARSKDAPVRLDRIGGGDRTNPRRPPPPTTTTTLAAATTPGNEDDRGGSQQTESEDVQQEDKTAAVGSAAGDDIDAAAAAAGQRTTDEESTEDLASPDKAEVLVPGSNPTPDGRVEVSNDTFADAVLGCLPGDLLYRTGHTVGLLAGTPGCRTFRPVGTKHVRSLVDQFARLGKWMRPDKDKRPFKAFVNCSASLADLVLGRAEMSDGARELQRLVHYPVYGPGFERIPLGWHAGTFYDPPEAIAQIDPERSHARIDELLRDLVSDFPFMAEPTGGHDARGRPVTDGGEANRQNFFGLLLTPILRPALDGNVPIHLVNAPMERTGKSKLVEEVLGGVLLGVPTPAMPPCDNREELQKSVFAMLLQAQTLVHLDNVQRMDADVLASLITATYVYGRELGKSTMHALLNTLSVVASGNNVEASGEIAKRTIPIRLQPETERPEDRREFDHPDLRAYVRGVRPAVLAALLGMVENWKAAGRPVADQPLGGFEQWARVVGGIMRLHGYDRWMANARAWRKEADAEGEELSALVEAWKEKYGDHPLKPRHILQLASDHGLFEDMRRRGRDGGLSVFGRMMGSKKDRPVGDVVIRKLKSGGNSSYYLEGAPHVAAAFPELDELPAGVG